MKREEPTGWNVLDSLPPWWVVLLFLILLAIFGGRALQAQSPAGEATAVLSWSPNPTSEGVTSYRIQIEDSQAVPLVIDVGNVTQYKVTSLKPGAPYKFSVQAVNASGASDFTAPLAWTPAAPFGADGTCSTAAGSAPEVSVIVQSYDLQAKRSDPKGLLVRFDAGSSEAIVRVELDLENDGEPAVPLTFPAGVGFDGRYVRALAFKPTINGTWPLLVTAVDAVGRRASARCLPGVTVGF